MRVRDGAHASESDNQTSSGKPQFLNQGGSALAPGPLATSAYAIFGNGSFFAQAATVASTTDDLNRTLQAACESQSIPFARLLPSYNFGETDYLCGVLARGSQGPDYLMYYWAAGFNSSVPANVSLAASLYFANLALLSETAIAGRRGGSTTRSISSSPGIERVISKISVSTTALAVLTVLFGLQALVALSLGAYIARTPVWTDRLDALAVARIGARMGTGGVLGRVGPQDDKNREKVRRGLDGVAVVLGDPTADGGLELSTRPDVDRASVISGDTAIEEDPRRDSDES